MLTSTFMEIYMDIKTVNIFFSNQINHSGQTFPLFCTLRLIRNFFWSNMLFMAPLCHTPTLQPHHKFCPKQAKTSYFDWCARPKPNHNLLILFYQHSNRTSKKFMGVFLSWSQTWIFEVGTGALPMGCWSAEHPEPL